MEFLISHCQAAVTNHGGLLLTLFLGGLMGSATHCVAMCGPFVMAQQPSPANQMHKAANNIQEGVMARLKGAALLPYHLGRMTTYMLLGIVAATVSGLIFSVPLQKGIAVMLLSAAGLVFLFSAAPGLKWTAGSGFLRRRVAKIGQGLGRAAKPFLATPSSLHRYGLGLVLGFLPCGLLSAALMAVAATASPLAAAMGMMFFCVGTMPALFIAGVGGRYVMRRLPFDYTTVARGVMAFNSLSLFVIAGGMILS